VQGTGWTLPAQRENISGLATAKEANFLLVMRIKDSEYLKNYMESLSDGSTRTLL
jgi:hypothetical protein